MDEQETIQTGSESPTVETRRGGSLSRWIVAGMILLWLTAILSRNTIRAYWWVYRLSTEESPNARLRYFHQLASLGDRAVPAISDLLSSDDVGLRSFGVGVLHHAPGERGFELLLDACRDGDLDISRLAIRGLAVRGDERSVKGLTAIADDVDERRAMIVAAALCDIGSESPKHALISLMRLSPHAGVRVEAIAALRRLRAREAIGPLINALYDNGVFDGVMESDMAAVRVFDAARGRIVRKPGFSDEVSVHVEEHHVVWKCADGALRTITGHSTDFSTESENQSAIAEAWRNWWRGGAERDSMSLP